MRNCMIHGSHWFNGKIPVNPVLSSSEKHTASWCVCMCMQKPRTVKVILEGFGWFLWLHQCPSEPQTDFSFHALSSYIAHKGPMSHHSTSQCMDTLKSYHLKIFHTFWLCLIERLVHFYLNKSLKVISEKVVVQGFLLWLFDLVWISSEHIRFSKT